MAKGITPQKKAVSIDWDAVFEIKKNKDINNQQINPKDAQVINEKPISLTKHKDAPTTYNNEPGQIVNDQISAALAKNGGKPMQAQGYRELRPVDKEYAYMPSLTKKQNLFPAVLDNIQQATNQGGIYGVDTSAFDQLPDDVKNHMYQNSFPFNANDPSLREGTGEFNDEPMDDAERAFAFANLTKNKRDPNAKYKKFDPSIADYWKSPWLGLYDFGTSTLPKSAASFAEQMSTNILNAEDPDLAKAQAFNQDFIKNKPRREEILRRAEAQNPVKKLTQPVINWAREKELLRQQDPAAWQLGYDFGQGLGSLAAIMGTTAINPALGITTAAAMEGGSTYDSAKQYGLSDKEAAAFGNFTMLINTALEYVPASRMLNPSLRNEVSREVAGKIVNGGLLKNIQKQAAHGMMEEFPTELLQEIPNLISESIYKKTGEKPSLEEWVTRPLYSGLLGGLTGAFAGGAGGVNHFYQTENDVKSFDVDRQVSAIMNPSNGKVIEENQQFNFDSSVPVDQKGITQFPTKEDGTIDFDAVDRQNQNQGRDNQQSIKRPFENRQAEQGERLNRNDVKVELNNSQVVKQDEIIPENIPTENGTNLSQQENVVNNSSQNAIIENKEPVNTGTNLDQSADNNKNLAFRLFNEGKNDKEVIKAVGIEDTRKNMDQVRAWRKEFKENSAAENNKTAVDKIKEELVELRNDYQNAVGSGKTRLRKPILAKIAELRRFGLDARFSNGSIYIDGKVLRKKAERVELEYDDERVNNGFEQLPLEEKELQQAAAEVIGELGFKPNTNLTYDQIQKGIADIKANHGRENSPRAKRLRQVIVDALQKGLDVQVQKGFGHIEEMSAGQLKEMIKEFNNPKTESGIEKARRKLYDLENDPFSDEADIEIAREEVERLQNNEENFTEEEGDTSFNFGANVKNEENSDFELTSPEENSDKKNKSIFGKQETLGGDFDKAQMPDKPSFEGKTDKSEETPLFQQPKEDKNQTNIFGITEEDLENARKVLRDNLNTLNSNPFANPKIYKAYLTIGSYYFGKGITKFNAWSKEMLKDLGEVVRPKLRELWESVQKENSKKRFKQFDSLQSTYITNRNLDNGFLFNSYKELGVAENKFDKRKIRFVNDGLKKVLRHKQKVLIMRAVPQLRELLENSVPLFYEEQKDYSQHNNIEGYTYYGNKINIDGNEYFIRFTVQELKAKTSTLKKGFIPNEFHDAFVSDININNADKSLSGKFSPTSNQIGDKSNEALVDLKLQNWIENVKKDSNKNKERIISEEAYQKALKEIRKSANNLNSGIDPTLLKDYAVVGLYHFEKGLNTFAKWSKEMIAEFGHGIRKYLRKIWGEVQLYATGEKAFVDPNSLNLFAGSNAKDFNQRRDQNRTFKGKYDEKERFEIDDSKAKMLPQAENKETFTDKLENVIEYPELFRNYPDFKSIDVIVTKSLNMGGGYNSDANSIVLSANNVPSEQLSILLHEIQHAIQVKEDFARGSSTQREKNKIFETKDAELERVREEKKKTLDADPELKELYDKENKLDTTDEENKRFIELSKKSGGLFESFIKESILRHQDTRDSIAKIHFALLNMRYAEFASKEDFNKYIEQNKEMLAEKYDLDANDLYWMKMLDFDALINLNRYAYKWSELLDNVDYVSYDKYSKAAGEIESRDIQARKDLTEDERDPNSAKYIKPFSSENISKEDASINFDGRVSHHTNIPADLKKPLVTIGKKIFSDGNVSFEDFSKSMIDQYGDKVKPHLREIYDDVVKQFDSKIKDSLKREAPPMGNEESTTPGYNKKTMHEQLKAVLPKVVEEFRKEFDDLRGRRLVTDQAIESAIKFASKLTDQDLLNLKRGDTRNATELLGLRIYAENRLLQEVEALKRIKKGEKAIDVTASVESFNKALNMWMKVRAVGTENARAVRFMAVEINDKQIESMNKLADKVKQLDDAGDKIRELLDKTQFDTPIEPEDLPKRKRRSNLKEKVSDIKEDAEKIDKKKLTENELRELDKLEKMVDLLEKQIEAMENDLNEFLGAENTVENNNVVDGMEEVAKVLEDIDPETSQKIKDVIGTLKEKPGLKNALMFWYYNMILSSPLTDAANLIGNTSHFGFEFITKALTQSPQSTALMAKGVLTGVRKGLQEIKLIHNGLNANSKFNEQDNSKKQYDLNPKTTLGKIFRDALPTTRLAMEDAIFRNIAREMEKNVVFGKEAKRQNKTVSEIEKQIKEILSKEDLTDNEKELLKLAEGIDDYAKYMTFQNTLGKTGIMLQGLAESSLPIKLLIPFIKTPSNIIKAGFNITPFGLKKLLGEKAKNLSRAERGNIVRRSLAGSVMLSGIMMMVAQGLMDITGQGPEDKDKKDLWRRLGYKPNHIYININGKKKGFSYQNINPFNIVFALAGNFIDEARYSKKMKDEEKTITETISSALAGFAASITDQSFLRGLSDFFNWMRFKNEQYLENMATGMVVPNIVSAPKQIGEIASGEKYSYQADSWGERLKRKVGANESLLPDLDVFGDQRQSGYERFPFPVSTVEDKKLEKYLFENDINISYPGKTQKLGDENMTKEEWTYFVNKRGKLIKDYLTRNIKVLERKTQEAAQDQIDKQVNIVNKMVKAQMKSMKASNKSFKLAEKDFR